MLLCINKLGIIIIMQGLLDKYAEKECIYKVNHTLKTSS